VHQIKAANHRIGIDAPKQPIGMAVVGHRQVDRIGDRRGMDAGQGLPYQLARRQDKNIPAPPELLLKPRHRILGDDLEIPGLHGARA
jgi:hypothetical protein